MTQISLGCLDYSLEQVPFIKGSPGYGMTLGSGASGSVNTGLSVEKFGELAIW